MWRMVMCLSSPIVFWQVNHLIVLDLRECIGLAYIPSLLKPIPEHVKYVNTQGT